MNKLNPLYYLLISVLCANCTSKNHPIDMNGTWVLKYRYHEIHQVVEIENDTISLVSRENNSKLPALLEINSDSINIPNPCVKQREMYIYENDTFFIGNSIALFRPKEITSKMLLSDKYLNIDLGNFIPNPKGGRLNPITFSIYLGKATPHSKEISNDYFKNGFLLRINEIICDTLAFESWVEIVKEYPRETTFIAIYKDKDFPEKDFKNFKNDLFTILGKKAMIFYSYFDQNSKSYFSYRKMSPSKIKT